PYLSPEDSLRKTFETKDGTVDCHRRLTRLWSESIDWTKSALSGRFFSLSVSAPFHLPGTLFTFRVTRQRRD
ncbi:hypothetical protein, partial [Mycobacterium tuberculosis]|uniref:hypothetical protein n=1 Tax=Mycobacterium tuberculosis TaxID=1773 RepID=UPI0019D41289